MSVKPELAFDVCWQVYRGARELLESKSRPRIETFLSNKENAPHLNEWVADFALAGQDALSGSEKSSRLILFRMYYLGLAPYETARHFLGLSEQSWSEWTEEIRRLVGAATQRRGMFPPRKYFASLRPVAEERVEVPDGR